MEAENGEDLLAKIPESNPDVILCDLKMPIKDGIDTTKQITKDFPKIRVIILTMYEDERFVGHLMGLWRGRLPAKKHRAGRNKKSHQRSDAHWLLSESFVNKVLIKKKLQ